MEYKPRLTCPEAGNPYYNRIANGGYSTCIKGNTSKSCYTSTLDVLPNCVGYALGRLNESGDYKTFKYVINGNAEDMYDNAKKMGLEVGDTPKLGAIICWRSGKNHNSSDGCGHVAVVEQIWSNDTIVTSESGWNSNKLFWTKTRAKGVNKNWGQSTSSYTFVGFIYNPAVPDERDYLKRGDTGEDVKQLQKDLNEFGWYDLSEDGSFGPATEKAVKDCQKKLDLAVDGVYGPLTKEALQKALVIPSDVNLIDVLVNNKVRQMKAINISGNNYIEMRDMYYKLNVATVSYNKTKHMPEIKTNG